MRREIFIHFSLWFSFFVFILLFKHIFILTYWSFWLGGALGLFLPDIDHLVYIFFLQPQELTSQRVNFLLRKKEIKRTLELLFETRMERRGLIFHTILFQLIFLILTFWIMTSSGSFLGKGLVLSFSIHLLVDQIVDLVEFEKFESWTDNFPLKFDLKKARIYVGFLFFITFVLGVFF